MQGRETPAGRWFTSFACEHVERVKRGETSQGFYTLSADGTFYGYNNNRSIERVNALMDEALAEFRRAAPGPAEISKADIAAPWARTPDSGAAVVRVFSRIRPVPAGAAEANGHLGRDHLWITAEEIRAMLAGGDEFPLPRTLAQRMVRYHLIDNVRGEPNMWAADEVKKAEFTVRRVPKEVAGVSRAAASSPVEFEFQGDFAQVTKDNSRGLEGAIHGRLTIEEGHSRLVRFRAYAECMAWGSGTYTGGAPDGKFPLLIAMIEANDAIALSVPPQGLACGGDYLAPK